MPRQAVVGRCCSACCSACCRPATPRVLPLTACRVFVCRRPAGEWFEPKAEPGEEVEPLGEQRETAVGNLWVAVGIYAGLAVVSGVAVCVHKVRGNL